MPRLHILRSPLELASAPSPAAPAPTSASGSGGGGPTTPYPTPKSFWMKDGVFGSGDAAIFLTRDGAAWLPPTDVYETAEHVHIKMELAGVAEPDLELSSTGNCLSVRGRRLDHDPVPRENFHLMEIHFGTFERHFQFPIDLSQVPLEAVFEEGFLRIQVTKSDPTKAYDIIIR